MKDKKKEDVKKEWISVQKDISEKK